MELGYLKDRKEFVSVALLVVSAFLGVLILVNLADFFVSSARAEQLVTDAVAQGKLDPNDTEKYFAKSSEIVDELKKRNLFAPPPAPKKHPVDQVPAILGNEVLINGKWYKVGDKVGDAKILAIEPTCVRIKWQGKEKVFAPIGAAGSSKSDSAKRTRAGEEGKGRKGEPDTERAERKARPPRRGGRGPRNRSQQEREGRRRQRAVRMREREARSSEEER